MNDVHTSPKTSTGPSVKSVWPKTRDGCAIQNFIHTFNTYIIMTNLQNRDRKISPSGLVLIEATVFIHREEIHSGRLMGNPRSVSPHTVLAYKTTIKILFSRFNEPLDSSSVGALSVCHRLSSSVIVPTKWIGKKSKSIRIISRCKFDVNVN